MIVKARKVPSRASPANVALLALLVFGVGTAAAQTASMASTPLPPSAASRPFLLGPPRTVGPVVVQADFKLLNIDNIDDEAETFEFSGIITFQWLDERQAFDPEVVGVQEKIYQGDYQFNEISPGWYPQEILVNESGTYDKSAVLLRVRPDGMSTLIQTVNAIAKAQIGMRRYPFDAHRLEAKFAILGCNESEVALQAQRQAARRSVDSMRVPEWAVESVSLAVPNGLHSDDGDLKADSTFVVSIGIRRQSFYIVRLVVIPLAIIVMLSFSVFWMDRSSLGDRIDVSFIGILTAVAYQILLSDILPRISYFTLINAFLNISFLTMCATVVINLVVGALDKKGNYEIGDRVDRRCRWIFPSVYFGLNLIVVIIAFTVF